MKPFICFSSAAAVTKFTSNSPTMNLTFIKTTPSGSYSIPHTNLAANSHASLGIYTGMPYSSILT